MIKVKFIKKKKEIKIVLHELKLENLEPVNELSKFQREKKTISLTGKQFPSQ